MQARSHRVILLTVFVSLLGLQGCSQGHNQGSSTSYFQSVVAWATSLFGRQTSYDLNKVTSQENIIPILIIGSGPAGLGAAIYGARDNIHTLVIEGPTPGGLLMYTTEVGNWGGEKSIQGPEIIQKLHDHAESLGAKFLSDSVEKVDFSQWPFVVNTMNGHQLRALTVIIATGATPKKLKVPGEDTYWGYGVTACAKCDALFFKDKNVVVVGGGDSAVEEALQLINHVNSVTILVRGSSMRAAASSKERIANNPKIKIIYNAQIQEIVGTQGDDHHVTGVKLLNNKTNEVSDMPIDGVFLAIGHKPQTDLFTGQLSIDELGFINTVDCTHATTVPGVFAAGECADHRYRQAWSSGGRGTEAALDALAWLRSIGFNQNIAQQLNVWAPDQSTFDVPDLDSYAHLMQESAKSSKPIVLDFWGPNCPGCLALLPTVKKVAKKRQDTASFFKVNAEGELDTVNDLVVKFKVAKIPTILIFKDGHEATRHVGPLTTTELEQLVDQYS